MWKASKSEWSFSHREVLSFSKAQDSVQVYTRNVWLRTFSKMCYPFARREAQSALPKIGSGHISPCASRGGVKKRLTVRRWLMSNASCFVLLTWWGRSCCMAWWKCLFNVMQRWRSISSTRSRRQVPQVPQATLAFHLHKCVECYCHMFIMVRPDRGKDSWTVHGKALGKANASSAPSENVSIPPKPIGTLDWIETYEYHKASIGFPAWMDAPKRSSFMLPWECQREWYQYHQYLSLGFGRRSSTFR